MSIWQLEYDYTFKKVKTFFKIEITFKKVNFTFKKVNYFQKTKLLSKK